MVMGHPRHPCPEEYLMQKVHSTHTGIVRSPKSETRFVDVLRIKLFRISNIQYSRFHLLAGNETNLYVMVTMNPLLLWHVLEPNASHPGPGQESVRHVLLECER